LPYEVSTAEEILEARRRTTQSRTRSSSLSFTIVCFTSWPRKHLAGWLWLAVAAIRAKA
jgi:hypothetical protein